MTITTTQKIIKIGTSLGVTIPAKALKAMGAVSGDEIEVTVRKTTNAADDITVLGHANLLLKKYKKDFKNLADR